MNVQQAKWMEWCHPNPKIVSGLYPWRKSKEKSLNYGLNHAKIQWNNIYQNISIIPKYIKKKPSTCPSSMISLQIHPINHFKCENKEHKIGFQDINLLLG